MREKRNTVETGKRRNGCSHWNACRSVKKIECRHLGLLVVDEEQRFGVMQKEKWKSWSKKLDVLTLSATPIPRTLHMSLTGVRDMVAMTQPPANRHAIQTYVTEYDDTIVKDAILHEKARGGQTYFIYNRIEVYGRWKPFEGYSAF